jgi:hypothetical protein
MTEKIEPFGIENYNEEQRLSKLKNIILRLITGKKLNEFQKEIIAAIVEEHDLHLVMKKMGVNELAVIQAARGPIERRLSNEPTFEDLKEKVAIMLNGVQVGEIYKPGHQWAGDAFVVFLPGKMEHDIKDYHFDDLEEAKAFVIGEFRQQEEE